MTNTARDVSRRLALHAEAVCRAYLPQGRKSGRYWIAGDVTGAKGRSLFVGLRGRTPGRWLDAATGERGDLLDLIQMNRNLPTLKAAILEATQFLNDPPSATTPSQSPPALSDAERVRRLWRLTAPLPGTLAETYLRARKIAAASAMPVLRFHPACYFLNDDGNREAWPALIAAVSDLSGRLVGLHRTYLAGDGAGKAPVSDPRRSMGRLHGHAVHLDRAGEVLGVGEGLETVLSIRMALPGLPLWAALSAPHLAALLLPETVTRLFIFADNDAAGRKSALALSERAQAAGIETAIAIAEADDFNTDLRAVGLKRLTERLERTLKTDHNSCACAPGQPLGGCRPQRSLQADRARPV
ncbi:MAG: toprim domain-containing protein [Hyphomicrobiales bacterium]|nr:toprim domain-containing protein [Hyphomicrobiales bacterium]